MSAGPSNTPAALRDLGVAVQVTTLPTVLHGVQVINNQAAVAFVQIHNVNPTLGTTAPIVEIQIPANSTANISLGADRGTALGGAGMWAASTTTEKGAVASAAGVQVFAQYRTP